MHGIDPYEPDEPTYECPGCGARSADGRVCDDCDRDRRNIAVPRE